MGTAAATVAGRRGMRMLRRSSHSGTWSAKAAEPSHPSCPPQSVNQLASGSAMSLTCRAMDPKAAEWRCVTRPWLVFIGVSRDPPTG